MVELVFQEVPESTANTTSSMTGWTPPDHRLGCLINSIVSILHVSVPDSATTHIRYQYRICYSLGTLTDLSHPLLPTEITIIMLPSIFIAFIHLMFPFLPIIIVNI